MGQGMKQQRGAALVIVLALLTGALVVGVSGMQSSLIDERLAGNYRATVLAQMAAEDVAGYIRTNYSLLPKPGDMEKPIQGWSVLKEKAVDIPKREDVHLRRSYFECDSSADSQASCQLVYDYDEGDWLTEDDLSFPFYIARGQVLEDDNGDPVAEHLVVVGRSAPPFPSLPKNYAILAAGAVSGMNSSANIDGKYKGNAGLVSVPDPRSKHASDSSRSGYIDDIKNKNNSGSLEVVEACDAATINKKKENNTKYVYCDSSFFGDVDDSINGLIIVSENSFSKINLKSDIKASFVSGGSMTFAGFGSNKIKGFVWSSGSIAYNGGVDVEGGIYANGSISFSGKVRVVSHQNGAGPPGYIWKAVL